MSAQALREGTDCPICSLGGTLRAETVSEADLIDDRTVVVHGVPVYVCDRCGIELFDEATTRTLERLYEHARRDRARTFVTDFDDLSPGAAAN